LPGAYFGSALADSTTQIFSGPRQVSLEWLGFSIELSELRLDFWPHSQLYSRFIRSDTMLAKNSTLKSAEELAAYCGERVTDWDLEPV
tara:strand:- start:298 stop:561 length:264 start_codon:yes stop_codon:yes gene_type:complete